jgi:hypothetical protein
MVRLYDNWWKSAEATLNKCTGHEGKHEYEKLEQELLDNIKALTSNNN